MVAGLADPAPAQPVDTASAEHVAMGEGMEAWHYLKRADLSVMRLLMAPGASEERHLHRKARLFVTALSGTTQIEIGGRHYVLAPGQGIEIPPEAPHRARNTGATPAELLVVAMPPTAGDREAVPAETP
jgi:mannose-6-phosphate isomerase-like protein (cupin superfamily)